MLPTIATALLLSSSAAAAAAAAAAAKIVQHTSISTTDTSREGPRGIPPHHSSNGIEERDIPVCASLPGGENITPSTSSGKILIDMTHDESAMKFHMFQSSTYGFQIPQSFVEAFSYTPGRPHRCALKFRAPSYEHLNHLIPNFEESGAEMLGQPALVWELISDSQEKSEWVSLHFTQPEPGEIATIGYFNCDVESADVPRTLSWEMKTFVSWHGKLEPAPTEECHDQAAYKGDDQEQSQHEDDVDFFNAFVVACF